MDRGSFQTSLQKAKGTGNFEIFGRPFARKFQDFNGTIETLNGTQFPSALPSLQQDEKCKQEERNRREKAKVTNNKIQSHPAH